MLIRVWDHHRKDKKRIELPPLTCNRGDLVTDLVRCMYSEDIEDEVEDATMKQGFILQDNLEDATHLMKKVRPGADRNQVEI